MTRPSLIEWINISLELGAKTGLWACAAYLLCLLALTLVAIVSNSLTSHGINSLLSESTTGDLLVSTCMVVIGFLPAGFLGALTGLAIGLVLWCVRRWNSPLLAAGLGVVLCTGAGVWIAQTWVDLIAPEPPTVGRLIWMGLPLLVYIAAGGIASVRLNQRLHAKP